MQGQNSAQSAIGNLSRSDVAREQPMFDRQCDQISTEIAQLEEACSTIEHALNRLASTPQPTTGETRPNAPIPAAPTIERRLDAHGHMLGELRARYMTIAMRLQAIA